MVTAADGPEVQPASFVTVNVNVPAGRPVITVLLPDPWVTTPPGFRVMLHCPAGSPESCTLPVGELQQHLAIPASTLSHHLSSLISVSLVRQERQGRTLFCHACYDNLAALIAFLTEECCADEYAPPGFMSPPETK